MLKLLVPVFKRKVSLILIGGLLLSSFPSFSKPVGKVPGKGLAETSIRLYNQLGMARMGLKHDVFLKALTGWNALKQRNALPKSGLLSIVDLSQSANYKRLYVIDMTHGKVLFNTFVAHGRNSGEEYAKSFSNAPESYKSSLGFYVTGDTYNGKHGLSLKLKGIENGINHLAERRAIVLHGADYVSDKFIKKHGRLGRSQGCPAVPVELSKPIIQELRGGSCLFIYHPDPNYLRSSSLL